MPSGMINYSQQKFDEGLFSLERNENDKYYHKLYVSPAETHEKLVSLSLFTVDRG